MQNGDTLCQENFFMAKRSPRFAYPCLNNVKCIRTLFRMEPISEQLC